MGSSWIRFWVMKAAVAELRVLEGLLLKMVLASGRPSSHSTIHSREARGEAVAALYFVVPPHGKSFGGWRSNFAGTQWRLSTSLYRRMGNHLADGGQWFGVC